MIPDWIEEQLNEIKDLILPIADTPSLIGPEDWDISSAYWPALDEINPLDSHAYDKAVSSYAKDYGMEAPHGNNLEEIQQIYTQLSYELGAHHGALCLYYPPGGYQSWHNNNQTPGRNVLFSWSKEGDGAFLYYNPLTGVKEEYQDKQGWNCRSLKFIDLVDSDEEGFSWHAMWTNCERISIAFVLHETEMMRELFEEFDFQNESENGILS
tara:strand:- start:67 stop:699 length:633 start_codon:yes stop_codon:yes gene_type:complete